MALKLLHEVPLSRKFCSKCSLVFFCLAVFVLVFLGGVFLHLQRINERLRKKVWYLMSKTNALKQQSKKG